MRADFLIIGGHGDLALRKLYPALYYLQKFNHLTDDLRIIVVARQALSKQALIDKIRLRIDASEQGLDAAEWEKFVARLCYHVGDATDPVFLSALRDKSFNDSARELVIYLAIPPDIIFSICKALQQADIMRPNIRLVIEKPLGNNLESFNSINQVLLSICTPQQIYRIDHYLGKEAAQNLLALRFANTFLEPLWNAHHIDHVQINVLETVGIEGRWQFYEQTGALRDMVQSHLLQLLCLVAMEPPAKMFGESVYNAKLKVLMSLRKIDEHNLRQCVVRGQYTRGTVDGQAVPGYLEESDADQHSTTETFIAIKASLDNWRWGGVPFYLRTGKRMQKRYTEIVVQFQNVPHKVFAEDQANRLVIRLQPDESIRLYLMNKVPGIDTTTRLHPTALNLSLSEAFPGLHIPDAYERLLQDALRANNTLFTHSEELELSWKWVDDIIATWQSLDYKPIPYAAGGDGPAAGIALITDDNRVWY